MPYLQTDLMILRIYSPLLGYTLNYWLLKYTRISYLLPIINAAAITSLSFISFKAIEEVSHFQASAICLDSIDNLFLEKIVSVRCDMENKGMF